MKIHRYTYTVIAVLLFYTTYSQSDETLYYVSYGSLLPSKNRPISIAPELSNKPLYLKGNNIQFCFLIDKSFLSKSQKITVNYVAGVLVEYDNLYFDKDNFLNQLTLKYPKYNWQTTVSNNFTRTGLGICLGFNFKVSDIFSNIIMFNYDFISELKTGYQEAKGINENDTAIIKKKNVRNYNYAYGGLYQTMPIILNYIGVFNVSDNVGIKLGFCLNYLTYEDIDYNNNDFKNEYLFPEKTILIDKKRFGKTLLSGFNFGLVLHY